MDVDVTGLGELAKGLPPEIQVLGIWGILGVMLLRVMVMDLLPWAKNKRNGKNGNEAKLTRDLVTMVEETHEATMELRDAHTGPGTRDEDGVFKWWNRKSTTKAILETPILLREIRGLLAENLKEMRRRP